MSQSPHDPRPLEYAGDAPAPGAPLSTWLIVVVVWTLGLASWTLWTGAFLYGFFHFFG